MLEVFDVAALELFFFYHSQQNFAVPRNCSASSKSTGELFLALTLRPIQSVLVNEEVVGSYIVNIFAECGTFEAFARLRTGRSRLFLLTLVVPS